MCLVCVVWCGVCVGRRRRRRRVGGCALCVCGWVCGHTQNWLLGHCLNPHPPVQKNGHAQHPFLPKRADGKKSTRSAALLLPPGLRRVVFHQKCVKPQRRTRITGCCFSFFFTRPTIPTPHSARNRLHTHA